jgi:hypothetical protein
VVHAQLDKLTAPEAPAAHKIEALQALALSGDGSVVPEVAAQLQDPRVRDVAEGVLRAIFARHEDPAVKALFAEGCDLMMANQLDAAK